MAKAAFSDDRPADDQAEHRRLDSGASRIFLILIAGAFVILLALALRPDKEQFQDGSQHPGIGQPMESFELTALVHTDAPLKLEDLRGEVVLINFWGTWCGPCMMEFPHLVELNERLRDNKDFRFVPVSCGAAGPDSDIDSLREPTRAYLAKLQSEIPTYSDQGAGARMAVIKSAMLSSFGFPTTVLLDRDGTIQGLWSGYRPDVEKEMEAKIRDLL